MSPNTFNIHTSGAVGAGSLRLCHYSIERIPKPLAAGRGIHTVSNAAGGIAGNTAPITERSETPECEIGESLIQMQLARTTGRESLGISMDCRLMMWSGCDRSRAAGVPFAKRKQVDCLSITAIREDTSGRSCAKLATRFSGGTKKRPIRSLSFRRISLLTKNDADTLAEYANK